MSFGTNLRVEREKLGVSLESLADATKVSVRNLQALEADRFDTLPGGVFQRGMVRSYCRSLGLDEKEWLSRFSETNQTATSEHDWAQFAENVKRTRISTGASRSLRWWGVLAMVLLLAAACWAIWRYIVQPHLQGGATSEIRDAKTLASKPPAIRTSV